MSNVFISYAKEDLVDAKRIYVDLSSAGITCWIDFADLLPGEDWKTAIELAIRNSRFFVALLSSNSVSKKGYVQRELRQAVELLEEYPLTEIYLIPVRINPCKPRHPKIANLHWVDLFPDYRNGLMGIRRAIGFAEDKEQEPKDAENSTTARVKRYIDALSDSEPEERWHAARTLTKIGPAAREAIPALIKALRDTDSLVVFLAAEGINSIGVNGSAIPDLIEALGFTAETRTRRAIIDTLGKARELAISALAPLEAIVRDELAQKRYILTNSILRALPLISRQTLPFLIELVAQEDVRRSAVLALAEFRESAAPAIPVLKEALLNGESAAGMALYRIGSDGIAATIRLLDETRSERAAAAFSVFESGADDAIPALVSLLEEGMVAAARGLGGIRSSPSRIIPALAKATKHHDASLRRAAVHALGNFRSDAISALPELIQALGDCDYYVRKTAAREIGELGPQATEAIPELKRALTDPEPKIRRYAELSLSKIMKDVGG